MARKALEITLVALTIMNYQVDAQSSSVDNLCSDIRQTYQQHCTCHKNDILAPPDDIPSKTTGQKGEKSDQAAMDVDVVQEIINEKFSELKQEVDVKISICKQEVEELKRKFEDKESQSDCFNVTDCRNVNPDDVITKSGNGGVYDIDLKSQKVTVFCDTTTDSGGWLVFQRRMDGSVQFYRGWNDYVNGFGNLPGEFWMGLEKLHQFTSGNEYEMRIDLENWRGEKRYAHYSSMWIGSSANNYSIHLSGYSGNAGDCFETENGKPFSTRDRDNDDWVDGSCSHRFQASWWLSKCFCAHLNGVYYSVNPEKARYAWGIVWRKWLGTDYSLKFTEMKIRRLN